MKIRIMDTTLRDGEQMQGVSYAPSDKVSIARALHEAGIDSIEIASAGVSKGEKSGARKIVGSFVKSSYPLEKLECLAYLSKKSIDWVKDVGVENVNILSKGSEKQLRQLKMNPKEHTNAVLEMLDYSKDLGLAPNLYLEHFGSEGGIVDNPKYVYDLVGEALRSKKVKRVMLCDTLGQMKPSDVKSGIEGLVKKYPKAEFDFHAHNDYGLAVANTLTAVENGCKGAHVTVNGMGERTGNAALHTTVVGIHDILGMETNVNEKKLSSLSDLVSLYSNVPVSAKEPIVGENAFAQVSGIHTDGMAKGDLYAGKLSPDRFGKRYVYPLGKHIGKATIEMYLKDMGMVVGKRALSSIIKRVKEVSDKKEVVTSEELPLIIDDVLGSPRRSRIKITYSPSLTGINVNPENIVCLEYDGKELSEHANGNGGYDAFMKALDKALKPTGLELPKLSNYTSLTPPGGDTNSLITTIITWEKKDGKKFKTSGSDPDQTVSAMKATQNMLNIIVKSKI
jgi:(R)-citramalate synthase